MPGELLDMIESDLHETIESEFGARVTLIDPDGVDRSISANDPTGATPLVGRVSDSYLKPSADGEPVVVNEPVVALRISSLSRIPQAGETWKITIPERTGSSVMKTYLLTSARAPEVDKTLSVIYLFPQAVSQL